MNSNYVSGQGNISVNVDPTTLNTVATEQSGYDSDHCSTYIYLEFTSYDGGVMYFSFEWETDYYEVIETIYDNSTITTYEPYILTYSNPSTWTNISLWFNGILLVGVAVLISPYFNLSMFKLKKKKRRKR